MAQNTRTPRDTFEIYRSELDSPARYVFDIDANIAGGVYACNVATRGIYIGTSGDIFCRPSGYANNIAGAYMGGEQANAMFKNVVGGTILPVRVDYVWGKEFGAVGNTTSTGLLGLY
jgi:hypothetical protein